MDKLLTKTQIKIALIFAVVATIIIAATAFLTGNAISTQINAKAEKDLQLAQVQLQSDLERNAVDNISITLQFAPINWTNVTPQNIYNPAYQNQAKPIKDVRKYSIRIIKLNGDIEYTSDLFEQNNLNPDQAGFSKTENANTCIYVYNQKISSGNNTGKIVQVANYCQLSTQELSGIYLAIGIVAVVVAVMAYLLAFLFAKVVIRPVKDSYNRTQSFGRDLSHEILTPISVALAQVQKSLVNKNYSEGLQSAEANLKNVLDSVNLIKQHSLNSDHLPTNEAIEINKLITNLITGKYSDACEIVVGEKLTVEADVNVVTHIINNILSNAAKYRSGAEKAKIFISKHKIEVSNMIDDDTQIDIKQLFNRGYRGNNVGDQVGMGLGLAIAQELANDIGWNLSVKIERYQFIVLIKV